MSSRKKAQQNYYYTLHFFGLFALLLEYGYYLAQWPTKILIASMSETTKFAFAGGLAFMILGFVFVILGRLFLNSYWGKDIYSYEEIPDDYKLVTENVYQVCRHPIYFGQACMCIGTALMINNWFILVASFVMTLVNMVRAKREDKYLAQCFKDEWTNYKNDTNFFIPLIF